MSLDSKVSKILFRSLASWFPIRCNIRVFNSKHSPRFPSDSFLVLRLTVCANVFLESTVDDSSSYDSGGSAQQGLPAGFNEFVDYAPQTDDSMMGQWNMYSSVWSFSQAPNAGPSHNVVPYQQPSFYRYGGVGLPDERLSPSCSVPTRCTSTTSDAASTFSIVNDEKKNVRMESIERYGFSGRHITDTFGAMGKDENKNEVSELLVLNHHHLEMKRVAQTNKVTDCCT